MARSKGAGERESTEDEEWVTLREISDQRAAARIQEYEDEFEADSLTKTDRSQIKRMAKLELAADDATNELTSGKPLTPAQRKALGDTAKALSAEARQLADSLGTSRSKRIDAEQAEQEQFIPKIAREAKEFLYRQAICIICPHCRAEEARVEILAGTIIYHFSFEGQWKWESQCPRCGKMFQIDQNNYLEFLFSTINKFENKLSAAASEDIDDADQEEI
jgi:hypothetical protein